MINLYRGAKNMDKKEIKKFVIQSARLIDNKKGDEIKVYDLKGLSS